MKTVIAALAIAISTASASIAQDLDSLAQDYMELPAVQGMLSDMFSAETMGAQFVASLPANMDLSEEQIMAVGQIMSEAMAEVRPEMESLMEQQSAQVFTAEELQAMIDFYSSDLGASILQKNTVFFTSTMAELNPKIMEAVQMRQNDIMQVLQGSE